MKRSRAWYSASEMGMSGSPLTSTVVLAEAPPASTVRV